MNKDFFEPIDESTVLIRALMLVMKENRKLRICIETSQLNKALKRKHFQIPVFEDLLSELADSKVFYTRDLRDGFWHLKLDEGNSRLTTFTTSFGQYR